MLEEVRDPTWFRSTFARRRAAPAGRAAAEALVLVAASAEATPESPLPPPSPSGANGPPEADMDSDDAAQRAGHHGSVDARDSVVPVEVANVGDSAGGPRRTQDRGLVDAAGEEGRGRGGLTGIADLVAPEEHVGRGQASIGRGQDLHFQPGIADRAAGPGDGHAVRTTHARPGADRDGRRGRDCGPDARRVVVADLEHEVIGVDRRVVSAAAQVDHDAVDAAREARDVGEGGE